MADEPAPDHARKEARASRKEARAERDGRSEPVEDPERNGRSDGSDPGLLDRIDGYQQRYRVTALPWAVFRKFQDDQAGNLAALIAYWAFFSVFPLLLAATTVGAYQRAGGHGRRLVPLP